MQGRIAEIGRYLFAGSANTLSTMAIYQLLVTILKPAMAYFAAGLLVSYRRGPYPKFVFGVPVAGREEERSR